MANIDNLVVPTSAQAREYGRKGGIASQKVQAQKRTFRKAMEWLVSNDNLKITKGAYYEKMKASGIDISNLDPTQLAVLGLWGGALEGNATNFKTLMETNNEITEGETSTPTLKIEITDNSNLEKVLYETNQHNKNDEG